MIPAPVSYVRASSVDEALALLSEHGDAARLIAGGQSLISLMKLRMATPDQLIDIGRVRELGGIRAEGGGFRIGALTTYRELLDHAELCAAYPIIPETVMGIGDTQVRNRGTVGGALAHADPASDMPALAIALDAEVELRSSGGTRRVRADEFCQGPFTTAMEHTEILTALILPPLPTGAGTAWLAMSQPASGYSLVGVGVVVADIHGVLGEGKVNHVRIGISGLAESAFRARTVEDALVGTACNEADVGQAAEKVAEGQTVASDIHADAEYRTAVAKTYVKRALETALRRAS